MNRLIILSAVFVLCVQAFGGKFSLLDDQEELLDDDEEDAGYYKLSHPKLDQSKWHEWGLSQKLMKHAKCPKKNDLRKECRADEVKAKCGSCCPEICGNHRTYDVAQCEGKREKECIKGTCECGPYTIYSGDKQTCIPAEQCTFCGPREMNVTLTPLCPETCENYMDVPRKRCDKFLRQPGCVCLDGFIRNREGNCVVVEDCQAEAFAIASLLFGPQFA